MLKGNRLWPMCGWMPETDFLNSSAYCFLSAMGNELMANIHNTLMKQNCHVFYSPVEEKCHQYHRCHRLCFCWGTVQTGKLGLWFWKEEQVWKRKVPKESSLSWRQEGAYFACRKEFEKDPRDEDTGCKKMPGNARGPVHIYTQQPKSQTQTVQQKVEECLLFNLIPLHKQ